MRIHICVETEGGFPSQILRKGLFCNLELTGSARHSASKPDLVSTTQSWSCRQMLPTQLFTRVLGLWPRVLVLCSQHFINWAISPPSGTICIFLRWCKVQFTQSTNISPGSSVPEAPLALKMHSLRDPPGACLGDPLAVILLRFLCYISHTHTAAYKCPRKAR